MKTGSASNSLVVTTLLRAVLWTVLLVALGNGQSLAAQQVNCSPTPTRVCLAGYRFAVEVEWILPGGTVSGVGQAVPLSDDTGLFWFFGNSNLELAVKLLDGRKVNQHFWFYSASLSNVEYRITVADLQLGTRKTYHNPPGRLASQADTRAFGPEAAPVTTDASPAPPVPPPGAFAPPPLRLGPEFQVNLHTPGSQWAPSVAIGADGGFMVAWTDEGIAKGRIFDAAGRPRSGELLLSAESPFDGQGEASVVAAASGEYVTVWTEGLSVFGQIFGLAGERLWGTFPIGADPHGQAFPALAADGDGGFLVAWYDSGQVHPAVSASTRAQRFGRMGHPEGNEIVLGPPRSSVRLASSPFGGFVMTWIDEAGGKFETDIWAQRLTAAGQPLGAFRVSGDLNRLPGYNLGPMPVFHSDGGFSVVWMTDVFCCDRPGTPGLFARRYGADGSPRGDVTTLRGGPINLDSAPAVVALPSGDSLVLGFAETPADPDGGLFGWVFDENWSQRPGSFRVNTYTDRYQTSPTLAAGQNGDLVALWSSGVGPSNIGTPLPGEGLGTQDGSYFGVFGQRFTAASCAQTPDQLCLNGRFLVEVELVHPLTGKPEPGHAIPLTGDTGGFWFFGEGNAELVLKIVDGRAVNHNFWVFFGALSDVEYKVTITDTQTGAKKVYASRRGQFAARADIRAFPGS